ncbi:MAG: hypothetical protein EXS05_14770 [Planctomycetaceae bacterium]|nr:hypothetical protein [Planctomycetaceae bacterium]
MLLLASSLSGPWLIFTRWQPRAIGNPMVQWLFAAGPYIMTALAPVPLWCAIQSLRHCMWLQGIGPQTDQFLVLGRPNRVNAAFMTLVGVVITTAEIVDGMWLFIAVGLTILTFSIPASLWAFEKQK